MKNHRFNPQATPVRFHITGRIRSLLSPAAACALTSIFGALAVSSSASAETPPQLFGVNLSGGEATGNGVVPGSYNTDYVYPSDAELAYYQSKGLTLIRLPVKWKRIQTALNGPLNAADIARIDTVVANAKNRGMKVIIDLHDYNEYKVDDVTHLVGDPEVPYTAFAQLWDAVSLHFKDETAIYGYDLMNEPKGSVTSWKLAAQAAIDAIRVNDTQHWILVEGIHSSRAWGWVKDGNGVLIDLTDSADRLIYSAHSYWDAGGSGTYLNSYAQDNRTPQIGIDHVKPFVEWCQQNGVHGLIGEYGVPWNKGYVTEWNTVLDNFMNYIKANGMSGTYWSGGMWAQGYQLSCEPTSGFTVDKPVMSVLQNYANSLEVIIDNTVAGSVTLVGSWLASTSTAGFYGSNYLTDNNSGQGTKSVTFTPNIPVSGNYNVSIHWTSAPNRSSVVPIQINRAGGTTNTTVNQQNPSGDWYPLGSYPFAAGTSGNLVISNTGANGYVIADAVKFSPGSSLPSGWTGNDIGTVGVAGTSTYGSGLFTITGSGATIGGTADAFQFAHQAVTGNCTIIARVASQTNTSPYARAGVMIRDGVAANGMMASSIVTPSNGLYLLSRTTAGATAVSGAGGAGTVPYWVKLTRVGNVFTAYKSPDGSTWTQVSTAKTIAMSSTAEIGLAVCSYANSSLGTATFDNVTVTTP